VRIHPLHRQLRGRIKQPQAFQFIAEKIEPQPCIKAGGEDIDNRPAHCKFAVVDYRVGAAIALPGQQRGEAGMADIGANPKFTHALAHPEGGEHALQYGVDRRDQQLLRTAGLLQAMERGKAFGADRQRGAGPVIGQAIPCREGKDINLGREELRCFRACAHCRIVGRDEYCPAFGGAGEIGQHQRQAPARERVEGQRAGGRKDAGEVRHRFPVRRRGRKRFRRGERDQRGIST